MFGASTAPHVKTPLFVLNSKYDLWQSNAVIGAGACGNNISNCSAPVKKFWGAYGERMVAAFEALPPQHGGFLSNCQNHCQSGTCHAGEGERSNFERIDCSFLSLALLLEPRTRCTALHVDHTDYRWDRDGSGLRELVHVDNVNPSEWNWPSGQHFGRAPLRREVLHRAAWQ
jgi:hypothetical protein